MTRREALAALLFAFLLVAAGLTWLFGAYGLIGSGFLFAAITLLGFERVTVIGEVVEDPVPQQRGRHRIQV